MPALNFKKRFAPLIKSGRKKQTIRAYRRDGRDPKKGDKLFLYTGMRSKECRKLLETVVIEVKDFHLSEKMMSINTMPLNYAEQSAIARADGFSCIEDFVDFFRKTHGLPFSGKLIKWS